MVLPVHSALAQQSSVVAPLPGCGSSFTPATGAYEFAHTGHASLEDNQSYRLGEVYFTRLPIFDESDPQEDNALFRWANDFHILTRQQTIEQLLLFDAGEQVQGRLLDESSRLLREQGFFYDADIRPIRECAGSVDVEVITKDNWSLTPSLNFDRAGGENSYSVGLRDSNLLGRGKLLSLEDGKDTERRSTALLYEDNNVFGSRIRNHTELVNSSDGNTRIFDIDLPFYSLQSRTAWALRLLDETRQDQQYFRAREVTEVQHKRRDFSAEYGFSSGLQEGISRRLLIGYRYQEDMYGRSPDLPPPATLPANRTLSYPYLRLEAVQDEYVTAFNLDQIYRTEDLNLGYQYSFEMGYASRELGSNQDRLVLRADYYRTLHYDADSLWQHGTELEGFYNTQTARVENLEWRYENRYFRRQTEQLSFFARLETVYSKNLDSHRQIVLGGQTGARGFENNFQTGSRRWLLSLEERLYSDLHIFNLVRVGAAVFIDAGRAWAPGQDNGSSEQLLANAGFGLRLASSKAASDRIAHLDFAFPVSNRHDPAVDTVLVAFTIKSRF